MPSTIYVPILVFASLAALCILPTLPFTTYVLILRLNNLLCQKRLPYSLWLLHRWVALRSRWTTAHLRWVRKMNYRMRAEWCQIELSNGRSPMRPLPLRFARMFWKPYEKYLEKGPKP